MDLKEVVYENMYWIPLGPYERGNEPSGSIKGGEFLV
jgi:hypothetical protein